MESASAHIVSSKTWQNLIDLCQSRYMSRFSALPAMSDGELFRSGSVTAMHAGIHIDGFMNEPKSCPHFALILCLRDGLCVRAEGTSTSVRVVVRFRPVPVLSQEEKDRLEKERKEFEELDIAPTGKRG